MAEKERLVETIPAFRVTTDAYKVIKYLEGHERRKISDVARALLDRGIAAFQRDGLLFEPAPEESQPTRAEVVAQAIDPKNSSAPRARLLKQKVS